MGIQIKKEFKGKGILFTRFDLTDDFTKVLGKLIKTQSVEELKKGIEDSLAKASEK